VKLAKFLLVPILISIAWVFFKIGLLFFGGGFVAIPLMHRDLVMNLHWLTERQFLDGIAISQLTPGPIAVLATFAGFQLAGILGALVSTAAIFIPGSALMLFFAKNYEVLKNHDDTLQILNTLIPVIIGILIATALQIGRTTIKSWADIAILLIALVSIIKFKVNPALLIISAALLGYLRGL
jgi:chromate transporter